MLHRKFLTFKLDSSALPEFGIVLPALLGLRLTNFQELDINKKYSDDWWIRVLIADPNVFGQALLLFFAHDIIALCCITIMQLLDLIHVGTEMLMFRLRFSLSMTNLSLISEPFVVIFRQPAIPPDNRLLQVLGQYNFLYKSSCSLQQWHRVQKSLLLYSFTNQCYLPLQEMKWMKVECLLQVWDLPCYQTLK